MRSCARSVREFLAILFLMAAMAQCQTSANQPRGVLSDPVDISPDFHDYANTYFVANTLASFDPATGKGVLNWRRHQLVPRLAFDNMKEGLQPSAGVTFPSREYAVDPALPFSIQFVSPRAIRIRIQTGTPARAAGPSPMLVREPQQDNSWKMERIAGGFRYTSVAGSMTILENPWHIEFRDAAGRLLTKTNHPDDNRSSLDVVLPFSFVRRSSDYSRSVAAVFSLAAGEKLFGCGESFTRLDRKS